MSPDYPPGKNPVQPLDTRRNVHNEGRALLLRAALSTVRLGRTLLLQKTGHSFPSSVAELGELLGFQGGVRS
jgi:hypothetical protein